MRSIVFTNASELAKKAKEVMNTSESIGIICFYKDAANIIKELCKIDFNIFDISIADYDCSGYKKEYFITICKDKISCEPLYVYAENGYKCDGYLYSYADFIYINAECNSILLKNINYKTICEYSFIDMDNNEDLSIDTESFSIMRSDDNNICGFTKYYKYHNDNKDEYLSLSYNSSNENTIKEVAKLFGIDL